MNDRHQNPSAFGVTFALCASFCSVTGTSSPTPEWLPEQRHNQ